MQPFHFEINLLETEKWGVKIQNENQKLVAAKWGGVKMRGRIMTKIELGPDHNQNTPSGGFEKNLNQMEVSPKTNQESIKCS